MMLEVHGLTKTFGGLTAVDDLSFSVGEGEIVGLIGPNGAGKTTAFNLISGFMKPDSGSVHFDGRDITGLRPYRACHLGIARTFQIAKPFPNLTVLKTIVIGALNCEESLASAELKAMKLLESSGLRQRAMDLGSSLSVVDRKALELVRALSTGPRLLLLDEVLAGLNPTELGRMISLIERVRDSGVTILMVEHVLQAVMSLSDRIVVLNFGKKLAEGAPREVATNPAVLEAYLGSDYRIA